MDTATPDRQDVQAGPRSGRPSLRDYAIIFLLLAISGNQAFVYGSRQDPILITAAAIFLVAYLHRKGPVVSRRFLYLTAGFAALFLIHAAAFRFLPLETTGGFFLRLLAALCAVGASRNFPLSYSRSLFFLVLLSFVFYVPDQLLGFVDIEFRSVFEPIRAAVGVDERFNILVHNFQVGAHTHRNAGFFWEPGAFAGYLVLAILLLSAVRRTIPRSQYRLMLLVLSAGVLTSFSTTGYLALPLALWLHLPDDVTARTRLAKRLIVRYAAVSLIVISAIVLFNLDFVGEKIRDQIVQTADREQAWELGRVGSFLFDWEYIRERPFSGWGLNTRSRFMLHPGLEEIRFGNGLSSLVAGFGLIGLLIYCSSLYYSLRPGFPNRSRTLFAVSVIVLLLNGEIFLNHPLFWSIAFLSWPPKIHPPAPAEALV